MGDERGSFLLIEIKPGNFRNIPILIITVTTHRRYGPSKQAWGPTCIHFFPEALDVGVDDELWLRPVLEDRPGLE